MCLCYVLCSELVTEFDAECFVDETLIGQLGGERGHHVDSAIQENESIDIGSLLLPHLHLPPLKLRLHTPQQLRHQLCMGVRFVFVCAC